MSTRPPATIHHLGFVLYPAGLAMQKALAERVREGDGDHILLLEHDPVFTLGRNATPADIHASPDFLRQQGISVHPIDRGGQVTYHGPGQVVAYPICRLTGRGAANFVHALEEAMIRTAAAYGVTAQRAQGRPGIWVGEHKLGALGIHLSRSVSTHGLAFNVAPDLRAFQWIIPCGMPDKGVCSLASLLGVDCPTWHDVATQLARHLAVVLDLELKPAPAVSQSISAIVWRRMSTGVPQVLIMLRQPSEGVWWSSVTGMVQAEESLEAAAHRETFEETGLLGQLKPLDLAHTFLIPGPGSIPPQFNRESCFHLEVAPEATVRLDAREHSEYRWCSLDEAEAQVQWDSAKSAIRKLRQRLI